MLLRSSSAPILGSILSSSSNHFKEPYFDKSQSFSSSSFIRRTHSDGNLNRLLSSLHSSNQVLDTSPSFSIYISNDQEYKIQNFDEESNDVIGRRSSDELVFMGSNKKLSLVDKSKDVNCEDNALPLFLARGLGIDRIGSGLFNAGNVNSGNGNGNGDQRSEIENYYRRMIDENPSNALFLSNYAQFLYQTKGDAKRAEEYYSRAILAEPGNGEVVSRYAKIVWELHKDEERASSYFKQAVENTPSDSHVLAAYASFLWETNDEDFGNDDRSQDYYEAAPMLHEVVA